MSDAAMRGSLHRGERKQIFVVGCPRSGTTWAGLLLAHHPSLVLMHHTKFFHYLQVLEVWWTRKDQGDKKVVVASVRPAEAAGGASTYWREHRTGVSERVFYELARGFASGILDEVTRAKQDAEGVVLQTPENARITDFILRLFPNAHFLHLVRDPRSVFCSLRSAGKSWARREFPTKPIDGARFWCEETETALRIADLTSRYREIRYEALVQDGPRELEAVFRWLGLNASRELCEGAIEACRLERLQSEGTMPTGFFRSGRTEGWREELSPADARLIEHVAGGLMERLGYEKAFPPFPRKPARVWAHQTLERVLTKADRNVRRVSRYVLRRFAGRELDFPELVIQ